MRFVALVCRISEDKSGRVEGCKAQERWGRAYAGRTWPGVPIRVYADNDLSASDDTERPEFERFRADLAAGLVAHVWAVEQSRLERREVEWFTLAAEFDAAGIGELHTNRDGIVRVRDAVAGIKAVLNADEVRKLKRRVNDTLDAIAAAGRPSGSRPYGYRHGVDETGAKTLHVVEAEAEAIREAAARFLAGWSLTNIARDLRARGYVGPYLMKVTASGKRYTRRRAAHDPVLTLDGTPLDDGGVPVTRPGTINSNSVRSWLTSPTVAGRRVHRGVVLRDGSWPAILDERTFEAVADKLAAPRRVSTVDGRSVVVPAKRNSPARQYLLTGGVAVCGVCGAALVGSLKQRRSKADKSVVLRSLPYYTCHPKTGGRGCVGIAAEPFEAEVAARLLAELNSEGFRAALADDEHAARRDQLGADLDAVKGRRAALARQWATGDLDETEWQAAREVIAADGLRLRAELAAIPAAPVEFDVEAIIADWEYMTLDERRRVIELCVERVTLRRALKPGAGFDAARIPPLTWRRRG